MLDKCLAMWTPGPLELIVVFIIGLVVFVLPILVIVLIIRSLVRNKREKQRLRLEVGKLADELQQVRKQNEGESKST